MLAGDLISRAQQGAQKNINTELSSRQLDRFSNPSIIFHFVPQYPSIFKMASTKFPLAAWSRITSSKRLYRSSQAVSTIDQKIYIFGGELLPREPVDNRVDVVSLDAQGMLAVKYYLILADFHRAWCPDTYGSCRRSLTTSWQPEHHHWKQHLPLFRTRRP